MTHPSAFFLIFFFVFPSFYVSSRLSCCHDAGALTTPASFRRVALRSTDFDESPRSKPNTKKRREQQQQQKKKHNQKKDTENFKTKALSVSRTTNERTTLRPAPASGHLLAYFKRKSFNNQTALADLQVFVIFFFSAARALRRYRDEKAKQEREPQNAQSTPIRRIKTKNERENAFGKRCRNVFS